MLYWINKFLNSQNDYRNVIFVMDNLLIKDLVNNSNVKLYCVSTEWTLEKVVSYLVDNSITACPVTSSNLNKGQIRQIDGYAQGLLYFKIVNFVDD